MTRFSFMVVWDQQACLHMAEIPNSFKLLMACLGFLNFRDRLNGRVGLPPWRSDKDLGGFEMARILT